MTPVDLPWYNATSCCLINFWSYNFRRHKTLTVLCPVILVAGGELFFVDHECHQGRWQQQGSSYGERYIVRAGDVEEVSYEQDP